MADLQDEDLILVGLCPTPRDLEIARVLGWYRIPLASAPKTLRIDWLALFLTASFGDERWSVRHLAPVRGYELRRRADLFHDEPDHPRAAEPYYRVDLGPLRTLARPIPARRLRRLTFLYTTGERLLTAADVRELRVPVSHADDRLWRLLREREVAEMRPSADVPRLPSRRRIPARSHEEDPSRKATLARRGRAGRRMVS